MKGHWTEELFVKHADLYQVLLEGMFPRAGEEARGLAGLLERNGVGAGATVLDIGCGIGRHAIHLARLGYCVVGVDTSLPLVQRARELAIEHGVVDRSEFVVADARSVAAILCGREFDCAINMFTSLGYYDEETDCSILRQCRGLTRPGGIFVLETGSRDSISRSFQPSGVIRLPDLLLLQEREFNLETSRMSAIWTFFENAGEDHRLLAEINVEQRFYALHELIALFENAGWRFTVAYRDFELREPSLDGNRLIVVCQAR